ncbi:hypothetical protein K435DRAFT_803084 [Dendrothele bispora CBS 962.96]|uniref:Uncharacterized protein n=1 Tax=Dendrothele bispora (strain CBS 962.96) TaxID=1314807 RepID=A0A4S8LJ11_DENBC|nr:hypothetical protein K435DRAFT_803084 [Dendrothele bispora CBS 962.96]
MPLVAPSITLGTDRAHYRVRPRRSYTRHTWSSSSEYSVDTVDDPSLSLDFCGTGGSGTDGSRGVFEVKNDCPEFELELEGDIVGGSGWSFLSRDTVIIGKKAQLFGKHSLSLLMLEMSHMYLSKYYRSHRKENGIKHVLYSVITLANDCSPGRQPPLAP